MFIALVALVFIYKFVVVGTTSKLRGSLLFHPRRILAPRVNRLTTI